MNGNVERVEHYPVSSLKDDGSSILLESLSVTKLPVAPEVRLHQQVLHSQDSKSPSEVQETKLTIEEPAKVLESQ